ncbi:helix-turn-helix transcriptional regulator [Paracraurococcus lichenis]|uniref:Helix-turn-helix transcriptional regulator n=1 Tax=Paracraurococcus lichenis TaxID=3064888 RepID=A0ABT9E974_9PROT|nr:helix-turn-helix transcriptional regulator [Paracraurococcus sp. LOR1-02]MDO9712751.1 helix-turn-helix transcriptional regulator [Paracraurococcus sp. LOR1-02]
MVSVRASDTLLQTFYDAALDPAAWPAAFRGLADALGSTMSGIVVRDADTAIAIGGAATDTDPETLRAYLEHFRWIDPIVPALVRTRPGGVHADHDLVERHAFERSEFFNDWARPHGHDHSLMVLLPPGAVMGAAPMVIATRRRGTADFDASDRATLTWATPHLARAVEMRRRLAPAPAATTATALALDRIAAGVIVVDAAGRLAWANRTGEALLHAGDGMALGHSGALRGATPAATAGLRRLVAVAASDPGESGALALERPASGRAALRVLVSPLSERAAAASDMDRALLPRTAAWVVIVIHDPEAAAASGTARFPEQRLRALHGLTAAETKVAVLLARGGGLPSVGATLGIAQATTRTHAARIFRKTGTSGQVELARLVEALSILRGDDPE